MKQSPCITTMGETDVSSYYDLVVVVPVYNEQDSIRTVLEEWSRALERLGIRFCIFVYNDGSKDNSLNVLRTTASAHHGTIRIIDKKNSGHGPTILQGYRDVVSLSEWIFQMDSDNEMGAESFEKLWRLRDSHDFLLGTRKGRRQPFSRKMVSLVSRIVIRFFYGGRTVWDVNSPYRLMRSSAFKELFFKIPEDTFAPNLIVSGYVAKKGLRFAEIEVPHRDRQTGEVSIKKWKLFKASFRAFLQTVKFSRR